MAEMTIWADTRRLGQCRSCGKEIEWAENMNGSRVPFDAPIRPVWTQQELFGVRQVEIVDLDQTPTHFASCPDAAMWRRRK